MNENNVEIEENEISLGEIFGIIKKYFWLLAAITILGGTILGIYAFSIAKPKYRSTGTMVVRVTTVTTSGDEIFNSIESQRLIETVVQMLSMDVIHENASETLKPNYQLTPAEIKNNLSVSSQTNGLSIFVNYTSYDVNEAQMVSNVVMNELIEFVSDPVNKINLMFEGNIAALDASKAKYVSPNKVLLTLVGMILGGTVGLIGVFSFEMINSGYKTKDTLEAATNIQVLGVIPLFEGERGNEDDE